MNENLALQSNDGLPFHAVDHDYILACRKSSEDGGNLVRLRQRVRTERSFLPLCLNDSPHAMPAIIAPSNPVRSKKASTVRAEKQ